MDTSMQKGILQAPLPPTVFSGGNTVSEEWRLENKRMMWPNAAVPNLFGT